MKLFLAPLAGFTSAPFRKLCSDYGADLTYTEMVSAAGLAHGSSPTRHLMEVLPGEGPVACQIFGSKPDELAFASAEATKLNRFVEINLNAGCPMTKIVREGAGAALIKNPEHVYKCLAAMKRETNLPLTLKTRPGPSADKVLMLELLSAAESAGCSSLILHARFTSQMHGGTVHLDLLQELVEKSKIPIVGNGSVVDRKTLSMMSKTGVSAIMIGRAALPAPWLFRDLFSESTGSDPVSKTGLAGAIPVCKTGLAGTVPDVFAKHFEYILQFREQLAEKFPGDHISSADGFVCNAMHTHLFRYFNGRPGAAELRRKLTTIRTIREALDAVNSLGRLQEKVIFQ